MYMISCILVGLSVLFLITAFEYLFTLTHNAKIKFSSFKKFYEINPSRWNLCDGFVICRIDTADYETFRFSYLDYLAFRLYSRRIRMEQKQEKCNASTKRMMDVVKQDIAEAEAKAKAMQNKALEDLVKWAKENKDAHLDILSLIEEFKKIHENNY